MTQPPIEDLLEDVLSKARRGLDLPNAEFAEDTWNAALVGKSSDETYASLAAKLNLSLPALLRARDENYLPAPTLPNGLAAFNAPFPVPGYEEMTVNTFIAWDPESRHAVLFDTGPHANPLLGFIARENLQPTHILYTHAHGDHIAATPSILEAHPELRVFLHENESAPHAEPFQTPRKFSCGALIIEAVPTPGHSPGGTSYVISGLDTPVAIVGDALFAASIGKIPSSQYEDGLIAVREHILSLPHNTILCPGHGPVTTVANEKIQNPFFA